MTDLLTGLDSSVADGSIRRDRWGRYLLPDDAGRSIAWTRATTFAKTVSDSFALSKWSQRMAVKGLTVRSDLYALAAATPLEDRETLDKITEDAKNAAGSASGANLGSALHAFTEQLDRGEDPVVPEPWKRDTVAYRAALEAAGIEVMSEYIERVVVCKRFGVAGTFDRVVRMPDGQLMIADLKTAKSLEYGWQEIAIQLAIYAHADGIWNASTGAYEPMPAVSHTDALVIHLPVGRGECTLHLVDIAEGWNAAALSASVRDWRSTRGLARPFTPAIDWEARIAAAVSRDELAVIWTEANARGQWSAALQEAGKIRLGQISG